MKIAIVVSHPIQHFCPQYASFAENDQIELKVFFASALGQKPYLDANFQMEVSWKNLRLESFNHEFLNGDKVIPSDMNLDAATLDVALNNFDPKVVIIYGYFQKLQRRAHQWAKKNKVTLAYISDSELRHKRNILKEALKYLWIRNYFSSIDFFLSVGNANEEFYEYYGVPKDKMIRMHFPIDINLYSKAFEKKEQLRQEIRKRYQIQPEEIVLSVVGKLVEWKSQDHIIDAMALLEKEGINLTLLIIGSGEMLEAWKGKYLMLKQNKVHFTGFVDPQNLPSYYAATDIYVHPASIEPHSIAISEAIYMGCPVIISDRCGSFGETDDVQENSNGLVYPFGNIPLLAEKIKQLMDSTTRNLFGEHSHQIAVRFQERSHVLCLKELGKNVRL